MRKFTVFILTLVLLGWTILITSALGHCATQNARPNSLGVLQTYTNPWTYMVGSPVRVATFEDNGNYYTNVEFKALGASMLNTVSILFCGNETSAFGDGHLRAVTYRTSVARSYRGVGCHEILPTQSGVIVIE
jgi:hypothetical protein